MSVFRRNAKGNGYLKKKKNEYFLQNIKPNTQKFCDKGSSKSFKNLEHSESLNFVIKILICTEINDSYHSKHSNLKYLLY